MVQDFVDQQYVGFPHDFVHPWFLLASWMWMWIFSSPGAGTLGLLKGDLIAVSKEAERGWVSWIGFERTGFRNGEKNQQNLAPETQQPVEGRCTPWKFNSLPLKIYENIPSPKGNDESIPTESIFRGYVL